MNYSVGIDWLIIIVTFGITWGSQLFIKWAYNNKMKEESKVGMTGKEVARKILDENGLSNVKIEETPQELGDHYDPRNKTVTLSTDVYRKASLASISVAAHECGHAIQDKNGYFFLKFRNMIVPIVNFASSIGYVVIMIGLFAGLTRLLWFGVFLEVIILFFQLITLPVEFNASNRALRQLEKLNIVDSGENKSCCTVLTAAALTYVASVANSLLQILRLVLMARRND